MSRKLWLLGGGAAVAMVVLAGGLSRPRLGLAPTQVVPAAEIVSGGVGKDGIPAIDQPQFIAPQQAAEWLKDAEPGIAVDFKGVSRFYPFQILVWHEIVNDTIAEQRVLVTYCPLCMSGVVFDPLVGGERVEFGVSGKLWNSNLVMYDRKTDSLWSQILGQAIAGEMAGGKLAVLASDVLRFGEWRKAHPEGFVLSRQTGAARFYGSDPYGDYYTSPGTYFPVKHQDSRLGQKELVLGLVEGDQSKAYWPPAVKKAGQIEDRFAGQTIVTRYEPELDVVRLFKKGDDGRLERANPFVAYWFSWVAAHPQTDLFK